MPPRRHDETMTAGYTAMADACEIRAILKTCPATEQEIREALDAARIEARQGRILDGDFQRAMLTAKVNNMIRRKFWSGKWAAK